MEYVLFALWCFVVAVAGGLVGLVLGNLRLPLVTAIALTPAVAAGTNIAISGVAALAASAGHIRAGRINWRLFAWMAPPSIAGAILGGIVSGELPGDILLGLVVIVLVASAIDLLRWTPPEPPPPDAPVPELDLRAAIWSGFVVGVIGGIVGLILGSLRMPALLRLVHETPQRAVGTNLAVGVMVGLFGALAHLPNAAPDLELLLIGGAASVPGALIGARLTGRLSTEQLIRAIAVVILLAAVAAAVQIVT